jgi:hypothetical protein
VVGGEKLIFFPEPKMLISWISTEIVKGLKHLEDKGKLNA